MHAFRSLVAKRQNTNKQKKKSMNQTNRLANQTNIQNSQLSGKTRCAEKEIAEPVDIAQHGLVALALLLEHNEAALHTTAHAASAVQGAAVLERVSVSVV